MTTRTISAQEMMLYIAYLTDAAGKVSLLPMPANSPVVLGRIMGKIEFVRDQLLRHSVVDVAVERENTP